MTDDRGAEPKVQYAEHKTQNAKRKMLSALALDPQP